MIAWRVVQALGASAAVVLGRAMVRDLYSRDEAARMLSTLMMNIGIAPMLGPIIGAQILAISSWHMIFWTLTVTGACTLFAVFRVGESHPPTNRSGVSLGDAFAEYAHHFHNGRLMAYVGALSCFGAGVFAYVAGSSFVFIEVHGLSPNQYSLAFATGIVGIITANAVNRRLVVRWGSNRMMVWGTMIGATAGLVALAATVFDIGGLIALGLSLLVYIGMNGHIGANAIAGDLSSVDRGAGSASALLGFAQYGGGMVGSAWSAPSRTEPLYRWCPSLPLAQAARVYAPSIWRGPEIVVSSLSPHEVGPKVATCQSSDCCPIEPGHAGYEDQPKCRRRPFSADT